MRCSEVFGVDIHPAARIGTGVMIDHAHSIVIGETAVVGNDVSMLHSVTLGGTGKGRRRPPPENRQWRHDRRGREGAGKYHRRPSFAHRRRLGRAERHPPCKTVAGVPARIVGDAGCADPSGSMNQLLGHEDLFWGTCSTPDPASDPVGACRCRSVPSASRLRAPRRSSSAVAISEAMDRP